MPIAPGLRLFRREDGIGHQRRVAGGANVVHADHVRALKDAGGHRGNGAEQALGRRGIGRPA